MWSKEQIGHRPDPEHTGGGDTTKMGNRWRSRHTIGPRSNSLLLGSLYSQPDDREKGAMTSWDIDKLRANDGRLEQARDHWKEISGSRRYISIEPHCEDLEDESQWIQFSLTAVLDKHATPKPRHPRSKR
jgi:hypothetical protein